jgi:acyl-lipid omega-6 desaturase (Delta-12 desaturase)
VWMFYVQHQFKETYWRGAEDWLFVESAIKGSSFIELPRLFQWFTGNSGFHYIHHLCPTIPNYYLEKTHIENKEFHSQVTKMKFWESMKALDLCIWDEKSKCLKSAGTL